MNIFDQNLDNIKTEKDLFGNEIKKLSIKDRIGFLPTSVWQPNWKKALQLKKLIGDGIARKNRIKSYGWIGNRKQQCSIFNPELAQMILSAYCPANAKIFDPFAGGGTRGVIATAMKHKYYGIELREEEVESVKNIQKKLRLFFDIKVGNAVTFDEFEENSFDFIYTCPPYYNLEIYSDMESDLSNCKTYEEFLDNLSLVLKHSYKFLKPNHLMVWVVGNFRNSEGYLIPFNSDLIRLALNTGFKYHDEIIWVGASSVAKLRVGQFSANRKSVRIHEYVLIFKK